MNPAMGSCREFEGDLAASLYGDLKPAEQAALDAHLAGCAGCRAEQAGLRHAVELFRPVPIKLAAHERAVGRPRARLWIGVAAAAAVVLAAILLRPTPPAPAPVVVAPRKAPEPAFPEIERPKDLPLPAPNRPVPDLAPPPAPPAPKPEPEPVKVAKGSEPFATPPPRPTVVSVARFEGRDVFPGDTLSARGELVYGDGSRILIGPDTSVREETGPDGLRLSLLRGELRASVAKQPAGKPFRIASGESTAVVLGTVLRLARRGAVTRLEVHEGRVKLDEVEVPAGRFVESDSKQVRSGRSTLGLVSLYTFTEGAGRRIHDRAGRLDLHIGGATGWSPDGLRVSGTPLIASEGPATSIFDACRTSNALTIEAWITPERAVRDFEGAVVGFSRDAGQRNFALIQGPGVYRVYGLDVLESPKAAAPRLTHVVFTRNASGVETLYLDGVRRMSRVRPGGFGDWDPTYRLELGDERTQERPWSGTYRLVAIYARALGSAEVIRNFSVGADGW